MTETESFVSPRIDIGRGTPLLPDEPRTLGDLFKYAAEIFTVVLSCFMTYSISNREPFLSAVVSQAVVVTMALVAFPEVTVASAAGAFASMASKLAILNYGWLCYFASLPVIVLGIWSFRVKRIAT